MRGPGRPPGSLNRSTLQWANHLNASYGPPLQQMMRFAGLPIRAIAAELGCSAEEAAEFKLECIERMLPYTHSEMPRAVDVTIAEGADAGLAAFFAPGVVMAMLAKENQPDEAGAAAAEAPTDSQERSAEVVPLRLVPPEEGA